MAVSCPNCGAVMKEYRGRYWCPRFRTLTVEQQLIDKNIPCNTIWVMRDDTRESNPADV